MNAVCRDGPCPTRPAGTLHEPDSVMQTLQRSFGNALATSAAHSKPDQFRSRVTCWRPVPSRLAATYAAELYVQPPSYRRLSLKRLSKPSALPVCMASSGTKTVLVPVANGSEEIEAVTVIDVLRRAGAEVTVASVEDSLQVEMSRQVRVTADKLISECATTTFDAIALPVGPLGMCSIHLFYFSWQAMRLCCKVHPFMHSQMYPADGLQI